MFCGHCEVHTAARIEGTLVETQTDEDGRPLIDRLLQLARCSHCKSGLLVYNWEHPDGWAGEPSPLWPAPQSKLSPSVPHRLQRAHQEAELCFSAKAYAATVVMVRRALEGVCADQGAAAKTLMKALEGLRDSGKIEGRLFDWAQDLRVLGNQGAHFNDAEVSREDAEDALALAEALMDYIYVLAVRYEEFSKRRQRARNAATP